MGEGIGALIDAERVQHRTRGGTIDRQPGHALCHQNVLQGGERGQQVELLQDDADVPAAEAVACRRRERREILAVDDDASGSGRKEAGDQVQQRGLPATGRTDDKDIAFRGKLESLQSQDLRAAGISEAKSFDANHRAARPSVFPPSGPSS